MQQPLIKRHIGSDLDTLQKAEDIDSDTSAPDLDTFDSNYDTPDVDSDTFTSDSDTPTPNIDTFLSNYGTKLRHQPNKKVSLSNLRYSSNMAVKFVIFESKSKPASTTPGKIKTEKNPSTAS